MKSSTIKTMITLIISSLAMACGERSKTVIEMETEEEEIIDADGDGFLSDEDCDDSDASLNPSAPEVCDGVDNNCDGAVDEDVAILFYVDADEDGFGDLEQPVEACEILPGYAPNGNDCDDSNAAIFPSATEICDGLDNDCDGLVDEDVGDIYYQDADHDGFGDPNGSTFSCQEPPDTSRNNLDCDDSNSDTFPNADEYCDGLDNNCDGEIDEEGAMDATLFYQDRDADGFGDPILFSFLCEPFEGMVDNNDDCDDIDTAVHPDAQEVCDEIDNDCDSYIDEADISLIDGLIYFEDSDGDGFGDMQSQMLFCFPISGWVLNSTDCDDSEVSVNSDATEVCDEVDNDCNGQIDDDDSAVDPTSFTTYYVDGDSDGYGDVNSPVLQCEQDDNSLNGLDCDDTDASLNPMTIWYYDGDGDGFGDTASTLQSCASPLNYVGNELDCDDLDSDAQPNASWYTDIDGDGYGDPSSVPVIQCLPVSGSVVDATDCVDSDAAVNPDASEVCDLIDNDCDSLIDDADSSVDAGSFSTYYQDLDQDGYGDLSNPVLQCAQDAHSVNSLDCDDSDPSLHPLTIWYADSDGDGFGDSISTLESCLPPLSYVDDDQDCDDSDADTYPNHALGCDGIDHDCDGTIDNDVDGDGYSALSCGGMDCDDSDPNVFGETGLSATCSVLDCDSLLQDSPQTVDGLYWIDPDGNGAFEAYCDMDALNMEGWTLVMRSIAVDIPYASTLWTTSALSDESNYDFTATGYSKYESFNRVPFSQLRSSHPTNWTNDYVEDFGVNGYSSALELFSGAGVQLSLNSVNESYFLDLITDSFYTPYGCSTYRNYGINQQAYLGTGFINAGGYCDWNGGARWGIRYNANHNNTGNHQGIGWGNYTTIGYAPQAISQLMWIR